MIKKDKKPLLHQQTIKQENPESKQNKKILFNPVKKGKMIKFQDQ